jgi:hypothetical protein
MPPKRTPLKWASNKRLEAALASKTRAQLAAKTADSGEIRLDGSVEDAKTAEEGSQIPPEPGPSGGSGGHAEVGAQTGATREAATAHLVSNNQESEDASSVAPSKRLTTSPKKKSRFDQKEPDVDTDLDRSRSGGQQSSTAVKLHVMPAVQAPDIEDVVRDWDDDKGNDFRLTQSADTSLNSVGSASLSFGSDTDYLSDTYVIIDAEVKTNGLLETGSLLPPEIIQTIALALDEQVVERTVFFPAFTRYFQARGLSFEIMIAYLLKHTEANQNNIPPLILRADIQRLRHIAHMRMGYLKATKRLFKDTVSGNDRDDIGNNIALIKLHMKTCRRHYHTLIPQLDFIATQWGVNIEDTLSQDNLGSLRLEGERQKRQGDLDRQLHNQVKETRKRLVRENNADPVAGPPLEAGPPPGKPQQKGKTSATNSVEILERLTNRNKDEVRKRRDTEGLLNKAEEDLRL